MFDHFKAAWPIVKANLVGWLIFIFVLGIVNSVTGGLGVILMPNAYRAVRNAIVRQEGPSVGDLFNFDNIMDDLVAVIVWIGGISLGSLLCFVGAPVVALLLFWMPMLAAEGKFAALDAAKASLAHAKGNIGGILMFYIASMVVVFVAMLCCYLPVFLAAPVVFVAHWMYFESQRDAIYAAALEAGVPTKA